MNKPIKGQLLYSYTQERNWGRGGVDNKWYFVEVVKVGRKFFYTRRLGFRHEYKHSLESYTQNHTSLFSSVEEVRNHFQVGVARSLLYKLGVEIRYSSLLSNEDIIKVAEVFPQVVKEMKEVLDSKVAPVLELEKEIKEMSLCP